MCEIEARLSFSFRANQMDNCALGLLASLLFISLGKSTRNWAVRNGSWNAVSHGIQELTKLIVPANLASEFSVPLNRHLLRV